MLSRYAHYIYNILCYICISDMRSRCRRYVCAKVSTTVPISVSHIHTYTKYCRYIIYIVCINRTEYTIYIYTYRQWAHGTRNSVVNPLCSFRLPRPSTHHIAPFSSPEAKSFRVGTPQSSA